MPAARLHLVRHGEVHNPERVLYGRLPGFHLSDDGRDMARAAAEHDYEVNLKAELEILALHQKVDTLRERQWIELVEMQRRQIELLERLLIDRSSD